MAIDVAEAPRSVKSAERVFDLLETIGRMPSGVTFGWLAKELGIPKSSLHALLDVLITRGYVDLDPAKRLYSLGIRTWETGVAYQRHHRLLREAVGVLEGIVARVNETAQLAKLSGTENVYLAKVDSTHPIRLQSEVGLRLSAHATGVGKALLAQLSDAEVVARFGRGALPAITPMTYATVDALLEELDLTRRRGFAIDNAEYTAGLFCLAVPVFDSGPQQSTTALSVAVPIMRATVERLAAILALIAEGSLQIAAQCGVKQPNPSLLGLTDSRDATRAIKALVASERYGLRIPAH